MRATVLFTLCSAFTTAVMATTLDVKPCYYGDSCETYEYWEGTTWQKGQCVNFATGMASFKVYNAHSYCQLFTSSNCEGGVWNDNIDNTWFNSDIGWLWSFKCI